MSVRVATAGLTGEPTRCLHVFAGFQEPADRRSRRSACRLRTAPRIDTRFEASSLGISDERGRIRRLVRQVHVCEPELLRQRSGDLPFVDELEPDQHRAKASTRSSMLGKRRLQVRDRKSGRP